MKKFLLILLACVMLFSLAGCLGIDENDSGSIDFDYEIIDFVRLKDFSPNEESNIVITTTVLEYENFLDYMKFYMLSENGNTSTPGQIIDTESKKYTADFFSTHDLVFIYTEDERNTINTVTDVKYSSGKGELSVELSKAISQTSDNGPKYRLILVSVPKTGFTSSGFSVTKFVQTSSVAKNEVYTNISIVTGKTDGAIYSTVQLSDGSTERLIFDISYDDDLKVGDRIVTVCNTMYSDGKNNFYCDPVYFRKFSDKAENRLSFESYLYLYPAEDSSKVKISLKLDGMLFDSFPKMSSDSWEMTASDDGLLKDASGAEYGNLSWTGFLNAKYDLSTGYCISVGEVQSFFTEKAAEFGLSEAESKDFVSYWSKKLQTGPYYYISLASDPNSPEVTYEISEKSESASRLYVIAIPVEEPIELAVQKTVPLPLRAGTGLKISEWGGIVLPSDVFSKSK